MTGGKKMGLSKKLLAVYAGKDFWCIGNLLQAPRRVAEKLDLQLCVRGQRLLVVLPQY